MKVYGQIDGRALKINMRYGKRKRSVSQYLMVASSASTQTGAAGAAFASFSEEESCF